MNTGLIISLVSLFFLSCWVMFSHHYGTKALSIFPSKKPKNYIYSERKVEATNLAKMKRYDDGGRLVLLDLYFTNDEIWFTSHWFSAMTINTLDMIQKISFEQVISFQKEKREIEITMNDSENKKLKILIKPGNCKRVMELLQEKCAK